jgi:hypothetical protein
MLGSRRKNMQKLALLAVVGTLVAVVALAATREMNFAARPSLSLCDAYSKALTTIGDATNTSHCIFARLDIASSTDGWWVFHFASDKGVKHDKHVTVHFDGKTEVQDGIYIGR